MAGPRDSSSRTGRARAPLQLSGSPPLPGYQFLSVHHHHSSLLVDVDLSAFPGGTHSDFKTCAAVQAYTVELSNAVCEDLLLLVFASSGKVIMLSLINKPREKILGIVGAINIFEEPDLIVWTLNSNGV